MDYLAELIDISTTPEASRYAVLHQKYAEKLVNHADSFKAGRLWLNEMARHGFNPAIEFYYSTEGVSMICSPAFMWEPNEVEKMPGEAFFDIYQNADEFTRASMLILAGKSQIKDISELRVAGVSLGNASAYESVIKTASRLKQGAIDAVLENHSKAASRALIFNVGNSASVKQYIKDKSLTEIDLARVLTSPDTCKIGKSWWQKAINKQLNIANPIWSSREGRSLVKAPRHAIDFQFLRKLSSAEYSEYAKSFEPPHRQALDIVRLSQDGAAIGYAIACLEDGNVMPQAREAALHKMAAEIDKEALQSLSPKGVEMPEIVYPKNAMKPSSSRLRI